MAALPSLEDAIGWTGATLLGAGLFLLWGLGTAMTVIGILLIVQSILIAAGKAKGAT